MTKWQRGSPKKIGEVNHCLIEYQKRKAHLSCPAGNFTFGCSINFILNNQMRFP